MADTGDKIAHRKSLSLDDLISYVTLHLPLPSMLNGSTIPFFTIYAVLCGLMLLYQDYHEVGLVSMAVFGFIQILVCLCCFWSVHINTFLNYKKTKSPARGVIAKVVPTANNGKSELVRIQQTRFGDSSSPLVSWFMFQKIKYIWDEEKATFRCIEFPVNKSLQTYMDSKGLETDEDVSTIEKTYGTNKMEMVIPEFRELFLERATAPFFVFQIFSVSLWCLEEYWYYSLFTLFMLILFECTLVQQQLRNMNEIRKMGNKPYQTNVYRNRKWRLIATDQLVPGDLISLSRSKEDTLVPCDVVLLRGTCIVDESMLTGESVPQMKESLENCNWDMQQELDPESEGKLFCLFGGTKIIQTTSPAKGSMRAPDNGCIGYVLRSGFNTSQGKLLRTILFGVKRVTENNLETFAFILFLMVFAIAAASYVWIKGTLDPERNRYKLFLECTLILTSIIPPDLPIELSLAVNTSLFQLSKLFVFCTEPFRIPFAGKIQICCFDKTGTLTSDNLMVDGVAGLKSDKSITPVDELPESTIQVLASCHSLAQLDDGLVGDPLEKATLMSIDWSVTKADAVVPKKGKFKPLKIIQRYHFSSALKRMSVLASYQLPYSNETGYLGTVKGAPEVIRTMLKEVPSWYEDTYLEFSRRGARVLALARKEFGALDHAQVREIKRESVESDLTFEGFVVISCPLKTDSKAVIKEIVQAAHKVVMITGDNPLTACHVAKELRFTRKPVLVLTKDNAADENALKWHWESIRGDLRQPVSDSKKDTSQLIASYDLCMTGESLQYLRDERHDYMIQVLPNVAVFARFAPKQKEFVITTLKHLGYYTLMCGDGTNDVGALKHANVGVSILSAPPQKMDKKKFIEGAIESIPAPTLTNTANTIAPPTGPMRPDESRLSPRERALLRHKEKLAATQERLQRQLKDMEEVQIVKLGDASIAAPFTSRLSSIQCVTHIIKQGRCTLVTTLQMFKILALNSLISAYSQSVLYVDGVKLSDTQATLQGLLLAACFLFITRSKPLKVLSKVRPLPNIFNFYTICTILGQFAVHFMALVYLVNEATARSPPTDGKIVLNMDLPPLTGDEEEAKFEPTLIKSTVYIMSMALQVSTFAVNYKGHPFMESLRENKYLLYSVLVSASVVIGLALNVSPELTATFEIVDIPDEFRRILVAVLIADAVLAFTVDRVCSFLFGERRQKFKLATDIAAVEKSEKRT